MPDIYTVKRGDTLGAIILQAQKKNPHLTYRDFMRANPDIKNADLIYVGQKLTIPDTKPKQSVSAEPTEGKCGNKATYIPIGKEATKKQVKITFGNKTTPTLENNQTYTLEKKRLEESHQGSLDITIDGQKTTLIEDLAPLKEHIGSHKDLRVSVAVMDQANTIPAIDPKAVESLKKYLATHETNPQDMQLHYEKFTQTNGSATCTLERLGYTSDNNIFVFESRHCTTLPPQGHIDTSNELQKRELALSILNNSYLSGLPPATKDTVDNFGIIKDHLFNRGWNGEYYTKPAKTGGTLIILKGLPAKREYLDMTRIKASNAKAGLLGVATGVAKGEGAALIEATGLTSKFNIGFVLTVETAKWYLNDDPFGNKSDLAIAYGTAFAKFAAAGVAGVVVAGLATTAATMFGLTIGGGLVILLAVAGTLAVGIGLDNFDNYHGITKSLQESWNKNIEPTVEEYIDKAGDWIDDTADEMSEYFNDLAEKMTRLGG